MEPKGRLTSQRAKNHARNRYAKVCEIKVSEESVLSILIRAFDYTKAAFQSVASGMKALVSNTRKAGRDLNQAFMNNVKTIEKVSAKLLQLSHVFMTFWILVDRARDHQVSLMRSQVELTEITWQVEEAQRNLNSAIAEFGPNSEGARKAAEDLWLAQEELRLKQEEIDQAQTQFNWNIGVSTVSAALIGVGAFASLATAIAGAGGLTAAVGGAGSAVLAFCATNPILLAAAAVAIAAITAYSTNFLGFKDFIDGTVVPGIVGAWDWMCTELPRLATDAWNGIVNGVIAFKEYLEGLWKLFTEEGLYAVAQKVFVDLALGFLWVKDQISKAWEGFTEALGDAWAGFIDWIGGAWDAFAGWISGVFEAAATAVVGFLLGMASGLQATWDDAAAWFGEAWESIETGFLDLIDAAWDWGVNLITAFVDGLKSVASTIGDVLGDVAGAIGDFLGIGSPAKKGALSKLMEWPRNLIKTYAQGLEAGIPTISSAASKIGEAAQLQSASSVSTLSNRSLTIGAIQVTVTNPGATADEVADAIYRKVQRLL